MFEPKRSHALERKVENFHGTFTFTLQKRKNYYKYKILKEETDLIINKVNEENEKKAQLDKIEKMRSNKNKIQDRLMSEHLEPLRNHKVWE